MTPPTHYKILWVSRHQPFSTQIEALTTLFGQGVTIGMMPLRITSAFNVIKVFLEGDFDDLVAVVPWSVLSALCAYGLMPMWAEMKRGRFVEFKRLSSVEMVFAPTLLISSQDMKIKIRESLKNGKGQIETSSRRRELRSRRLQGKSHYASGRIPLVSLTLPAATGTSKKKEGG